MKRLYRLIVFVSISYLFSQYEKVLAFKDFSYLKKAREQILSGKQNIHFFLVAFLQYGGYYHYDINASE